MTGKVARKSVYANFRNTAVIPTKCLQNVYKDHIELALAEVVFSRLCKKDYNKGMKFKSDAAEGLRLSNNLRGGQQESAAKNSLEQKLIQHEIYQTWLRPFKNLLTEHDIKKCAEESWKGNENFNWITNELSQRMAYSRAEKMPLFLISDAISPMVKFALRKHYGDLLDNVIDLYINAPHISIDQIMIRQITQRVFTGKLFAVNSKVFGGVEALGPNDFIMIGDHSMRAQGFGEQLVVINEKDGTYNKDTVLKQLDKLLLKG